MERYPAKSWFAEGELERTRWESVDMVGLQGGELHCGLHQPPNYLLTTSDSRKKILYFCLTPPGS